MKFISYPRNDAWNNFEMLMEFRLHNGGQTVRVNELFSVDAGFVRMQPVGSADVQYKTNTSKIDIKNGVARTTDIAFTDLTEKIPSSGN